MTRNRSGPVRAAIGLVLLYSALTAVHRLRAVAGGFTDRAEDEISRYDRRFLELRKVMPPRGVVGYVTDAPVRDGSPERVAADAHDRFKRYLLAQYALAPLVVIDGTQPDIVIGNFAEQAGSLAPPGFRIVGDFGAGVVLYRRR